MSIPPSLENHGEEFNFIVSQTSFDMKAPSFLSDTEPLYLRVRQILLKNPVVIYIRTYCWWKCTIHLIMYLCLKDIPHDCSDLTRRKHLLTSCLPSAFPQLGHARPWFQPSGYTSPLLLAPDRGGLGIGAEKAKTQDRKPQVQAGISAGADLTQSCFL